MQALIKHRRIGEVLCSCKVPFVCVFQLLFLRVFIFILECTCTMCLWQAHNNFFKERKSALNWK